MCLVSLGIFINILNSVAYQQNYLTMYYIVL